MPKLVIFDVDGTLVQSVKIDTQCYVQSLKELFGITNIDTRWHLYRTATDSAILDAIFEKALMRKPSKAEMRMHVERFKQLLAVKHEKNPGLFQEVGGARNMLARLKLEPKWKTGIASGGWRDSTLLKLKLTGFDMKGMPFVSGSDAKIRENIFKKCIRLAKKCYGIGRFSKIVLVGDALWDLKTARKLKIGFLGVNTRGVFKGIRDCLTLTNYRNYKKFMALLEQAKIPQ